MGDRPGELPDESISAGDLSAVNFITLPGAVTTIDGSTGDDDLEGPLAQEVIRGLAGNDMSVDNRQLVEVNAAIRDHSIEVVGRKLRGYMTGMKAII